MKDAQQAGQAQNQNAVTDETQNIVDGAAPPVEEQQQAAPPAEGAQAVVEAQDAAPPAGGDDAAKPAIGSDEWIESPDTSAEDLRAYMRGELKPDGEEAPADAKAAGEEEQPRPAAEEAKPFEFTADADEETRAKEEAAFLEQYELDPATQNMLDHRNAQIETLKAELATRPEVGGDADFVQALDTLVEFRKDEATGRMVPNTDGLIGYFQKNFKAELPQLIVDLNSLPSEKYAGATLMQEFIHDTFDLDAEAMQRFDRFTQNGGRFDVPDFVPEGIEPRLTEAFWLNPDRDMIVQQLERIDWTLNKDVDATAADKQAAQNQLQELNGKLAILQDGYDAKKAQREAVIANRQNNITALQHATVDRFVETTGAILDEIGLESSKGLDFMGAGAELTGLAIGNLIQNSFSDNEGDAKRCQDKLAKHGITVNWPEAFALRDKLFEAIGQVVSLEKQQGVNPRAVEKAKQQVDAVVQELRGKAKQVAGQINAKMATGAGKKLEADIAGAKRIPAAKPRTQGDAASKPATVNYDDMPLDELRREIRKARAADPYARAVRGDMSAFA